MAQEIKENDVEMEEKIITTIRDFCWTKYDKYRVVLGIHYEKDQVFWLTEKQMGALRMAFRGSDYSDKHRQIIGVFKGKYYLFCKVKKLKPERWFKTPKPQNLSDLEDY